MSIVNVVFFGALKDSIGLPSAKCEVQSVLTVAQLKQLLADQLSAPQLLEPNIKSSIDFEFARDTDEIEPTAVQEVAFFPPVTGG
ncbi:MoaD/ThiS family protein [Marinomonas piezotolerans]|uniref:MoaD/ThiS family protein n=1 Tax=Marinomonas piezotolerans TaxID=2213058 RepID=A0A370UE49_9GAMM|nr:MoaD/ThiS family protein [Marinomonas piezotolerans]RDL46060.1 MoaD/ThiS family protein [Marinomonas piezotolerans]